MRARLHLAAALALASCRAPDPGLRQALEFDWARSVLLGSEVGDARAVVVRWPGPVTYLVVGGGERQQRALHRAFDQLQQALEGAAELRLEIVGQDDARLGQDGYVSMFWLAPRDAGELAGRFGGHRPSEDADGWFTVRWNARFELHRAVVFVAPGLDDDWLEHTTLEEMMQVLGPTNDSPLLPESVVFEGAGTPGRARRLARVDRELLRMLYGRLCAGDGAAAIAAAMADGWDFVAR